MAWISSADFKTSFPAAKQATDGQINLSSAAAEDELIELVGQTIVDDAKAAVPVNVDRSAKVIRSHTFLTFANFLLNANHIKRQQDPASPATQQTITNEYYSIKELKELAEFWRGKAIKAVEAYLTEEAESEEIISPKGYSSHAAVTADW